MTKISNKFRKPFFDPFLDHFWTKIPPPPPPKKKSTSVTHNTTWASNTMLSFRKKLMNQSQENFQTEGRKGRRMEGRTEPNL